MNTAMISPLYKTAAGEQAVMERYDDALKNCPVPYNTSMIQTRHGKTFVITSGKENLPALILLHGAGGNSSMWLQDMSEYCKQFQVFAVDLPGEAGKSTTNRPAWETDAFAEWLDDVLTGLEIEHATIVGISQGAWAGLKFAVKQPERVDRLVLMAPGGIVPDRKSALIRVIGLGMLGKPGMRLLMRSFFGDQEMPQQVIDYIVDNATEFKSRMGLLPIFTDEELSQLKMPTLLIGGTKDILRDLGKIEARLRKFVPDLKVSMIAGAGHILIYTRDRVIDFLVQ